MIGRKIDLQRGWLGIGASVCLLVFAGQRVHAQSHPAASPASPEALTSSDPRAAARFRAAAALQNRELYDLAAAEWSAFVREFANDPIAARARFERGVCLFHLERYNDAQGEFQTILEQGSQLEPALAEQCYAHLGLAQYNAGRLAGGDAGSKALNNSSLDAAVATFDRLLEQFADGPWAPEAAFYRAEALYARGGLTEAIAGYEALVSQHPAHPRRADVLYALAVAQHDAGRSEESAGTFAKFLTEFRGHELAADAQVRRGEALLAASVGCLERGRVELALEMLTEAAALPRWPGADAALFALAEAQHAHGDSSAAIATLDRLLDEFSESELSQRAYLCRGERHAAAQNWQAALADFDRLLRSWPDSDLAPRALVAQARAHFGERELAAAEASADAFLKRYPRHALVPDAIYLRARIRHARGDFAAAIQDLETFVATDPPRPRRSDARYVQGLCELGLRRPQDAARTLARIVRKDPQYRSLDRVLYDLAWARHECGDAKRAVAAFARLAESFPHSPLAAESWFRVGQGQFTAGELSRAVHSFQQAHRLATDSALLEKVRHKLAWCHFDLQQYDLAERMFEAQLDQSPAGPLATDARLLIGECRFQQQRFSEALEAFAAALDQPSASQSLRELALVHAGQSAAHVGDWQQSLAWLDRSLRDFPNGPWAEEVCYERGCALYHLKRWDESQQHFEKVAAGNSGLLGARAEYMLGRAFCAQQKYDDAVRTFFKVTYGYGDQDAPEPYHPWQADAMFEAAQCLEKTNRLESARQTYRELLSRFPASAKASLARNSLEQITR